VAKPANQNALPANQRTKRTIKPDGLKLLF